MTLDFYYGSGSPYAWKVWLTLEHKRLPYELHVLSFDKREHKTSDYLLLNPRGKVPTLVHDGFALNESSAIVEYLDEVFPERPVLPREPRARATARRLAAEADNHLYAPIRALMQATLYRAPEAVVAADVEAGRTALRAELAVWEERLGGAPWFMGDASVVDFAVLPMLRSIDRIEQRRPALGIGADVPPRLRAYVDRLTAEPWVDKTTPPHWRG